MPDLNPNALPYADKLRVRVCGICIKEDKLLLVRHSNTIDNKAFWAPPGGGIEFGETMHQGLKREMLEETGLQVQVCRFLFVNEYVNPPLHAVEFFFEVAVEAGEIITALIRK
ncbi:hypothetical protein GCM10028895_09580 [Pontibacter rugosus]